MRVLTQPLIVALLCAILTLLGAFIGGLKMKHDAENRELIKQRAAWDTAIHQELRALPDPFETPKWNDQDSK
ncbi:MAG: hypothetical protein WB586_26050 [Chthoniobacterales bacterium]